MEGVAEPLARPVPSLIICRGRKAVHDVPFCELACALVTLRF
jgi:hypothetical protein